MNHRCHGVDCLGRAMTCKPATARMAQGITVDGKKPVGENKALKIKPLGERPEGGTTVCFVMEDHLLLYQELERN